MVFLSKYGYPIVRWKDKPLRNILCYLFQTRKIKFGYWDGYKIIRQNSGIRWWIYNQTFKLFGNTKLWPKLGRKIWK